MSTPFLGEIKIIAWNYAPKGWAFCNGQFLPINQNQPLFSLLGTMYGGNGQTTFALPDFRGKVPMHIGGGHTQGETAGQYAHTVTASEMPAHNHFMQVTNNTGSTQNPSTSTSGRRPRPSATRISRPATYLPRRATSTARPLA